MCVCVCVFSFASVESWFWGARTVENEEANTKAISQLEGAITINLQHALINDFRIQPVFAFPNPTKLRNHTDALLAHLSQNTRCFASPCLVLASNQAMAVDDWSTTTSQQIYQEHGQGHMKSQLECDCVYTGISTGLFTGIICMITWNQYHIIPEAIQLSV